VTHAIVGFAGILRAAGLLVTTPAVIDAVAAVELVDRSDRGEVYLALRTLLMSRVEERSTFDRCFDAFWRLQTQPTQVAKSDPELSDQTPEPAWVGGDPEQIGGDREPPKDTLELPGGSAHEQLMEQDFTSFKPEELDEVARLTVQIAKRLARRVSRRRKRARRGGTVDLRRSMRGNLLKGEIIELRRIARQRRKPSLVILCDVSGSMDVYSRFLLQFIFALQNVFGRVETFTFTTRITRVSELLRGPSYATALHRLTQVKDWSGGTRIGESLREFNQAWSRLVNRRTVVLILSDGWDTGEPDILATEMQALKRRAARVVWLNPLLGNPGYEPLNRGMAAALPFVHHFAPAHNLASLRALPGKLTAR
jgi:uncharacterized protein with von Willebrand factor type A (vWA) domain